MLPVSSSHQHYAKICQPALPVAVGGATLKWYEIYAPGADIPDGVRALAIAAAASNPSELAEGEAGFVMLHRCGEAFYFLLIQTWRNGNELWETVYYKDAPMRAFAPSPAAGVHRPTFCVWEMAAVWHETNAWRRYLLSERGPADFSQWQSDTLSGEV
jgi:hypothetical protein